MFIFASIFVVHLPPLDLSCSFLWSQASRQSWKEVLIQIVLFNWPSPKSTLFVNQSPHLGEALLSVIYKPSPSHSHSKEASPEQEVSFQHPHGQCGWDVIDLHLLSVPKNRCHALPEGARRCATYTAHVTPVMLQINMFAHAKNGKKSKWKLGWVSFSFCRRSYIFLPSKTKQLRKGERFCFKTTDKKQLASCETNPRELRPPNRWVQHPSNQIQQKEGEEGKQTPQLRR